MKTKINAHWRDSVRPVRFFIWDGKTAFPMLIFLLYMKWETFIIAILTMIFFSFLNRYGFSLEVFWRFLRNLIVGTHKSVKPWWNP